MTLKQKSNVKGVRGHQKVFVDRDQAYTIGKDGKALPFPTPVR